MAAVELSGQSTYYEYEGNLLRRPSSSFAFIFAAVLKWWGRRAAPTGPRGAASLPTLVSFRQ
jgi:hypothetical protein